MQILHIGGNHWCVVSNVGCEGCEGAFVNLYDTLFDSISEDTLLTVARLVFSSASTLTIRMMMVEKQTNLSDCEILSIAIAHEICSLTG